MAKIREIKLRNFRNFKEAVFQFDPETTLLTGSNGTGKTSALEAVFFLSKLRSFRTSHTVEMCRIGETFFQLALTLEKDGGWTEELKLSDGEFRKLFIDDVPVSKTSAFAGRFETVAFLPDDPLIVTGSPSCRRKFIDMLIASMDHNYFLMLQQYRQALENYNRILIMRPVRRDAAAPFSDILSNIGSSIIRRRLDFYSKIQSSTARILNEMRPELSDFTIIPRHDPDLENPESYARKLENSFERDSIRGKTAVGPHYSDFDMIASEKLLRNFGSRGQCRIVSLALKLSELELLNSNSSKKPVILVDDAFADLDQKLCETFLNAINHSGQKIFAFPEKPVHNYFMKINEIHLGR